eukprot:TRINITY_DN2972_c0_g2_i5.p2 TRINITY_DN2972_c0_g2~~TRINITY_DN2972_c0_g2_i5.p2  ORF type:complete len:269 (+),score=75.56 TRINITY_DN2972_c0_g2_i5:295-1101(+)
MIDCNLSCEERHYLYTFKWDAVDSKYLKRIDWILYSNFFKNDSNKFQVLDPDFSTDHKAIKQVFSIPLNSELAKEKTKEKRIFQIPEKSFNDSIFISNLNERLKKSKKKHGSYQDKLQYVIDEAIETAKEHKREIMSKLQKKMRKIWKKVEKVKKEKEGKKQKVDLESSQSYDSTETSENKVDNFEEEISELSKQIDVFWKEIEELKWKKKIDFDKIKGANKIYSMHLKFKTSIKSKLEYFQKEDGEKMKGMDAANLAKEVYEEIYKN